jgi:hypothetical protein
VYAWESFAASTCGLKWGQEISDMDDVRAFLAPIWRAERGRYGRAKVKMPEVTHAGWGQRRAIAHADHRISLPKWARNRWVIMHEAAHLLDHRSLNHGPRFVGILIGLAARHLGADAELLMTLADERGVRYDVRSIGAVPIVPLAEKLINVLPCTPIEGAVALGVSYRQVQGAALRLIRARRASWWRGKLVAIEGPPSPPTL